MKVRGQTLNRNTVEQTAKKTLDDEDAACITSLVLVPGVNNSWLCNGLDFDHTWCNYVYCGTSPTKEFRLIVKISNHLLDLDNGEAAYIANARTFHIFFAVCLTVLRSNFEIEPPPSDTTKKKAFRSQLTFLKCSVTFRRRRVNETFDLILCDDFFFLRQDPLDLSFWSILTFLHHGIEEIERHLP